MGTREAETSHRAATGTCAAWRLVVLLAFRRVLFYRLVRAAVFRLRADHAVADRLIAIICLSYNMLLGQGGMLSFGHAVLFGLGAYSAAHASTWSRPARSGCRPTGAAGRRAGRHVLRRCCFGFADDQEARHHLRDDHAGHRRAGLGRCADVPGLLRRRGRHQRRPRHRTPACSASASARSSRSTT